MQATDAMTRGGHPPVAFGRNPFGALPPCLAAAFIRHGWWNLQLMRTGQHARRFGL